MKLDNDKPETAQEHMEPEEADSEVTSGATESGTLEPNPVEMESDEQPEPTAPGTSMLGDDPETQAEESEPADDDFEPDVTYEDGRPLVQELEYQVPKGKTGAPADEDEHLEVRFSSVSEAKAVIEGFLFSCNEPLSVSKLSKLMSNLHPKTVRGLLLELQWEYENRPGGLQVVEIAGGYQMSTRAFVAPWMFRMHKHKRRSALSPATLETLAIIAYRQPITKGEIEAIRGVESGAPLRTLQELNLVEASGRREVIGRPQLYVTTEQFLKTFGLKSVGDLPSISELKSRYAEEQKLKPVVAAPSANPEEYDSGQDTDQRDQAGEDVPGESLINDTDVTDELLDAGEPGALESDMDDSDWDDVDEAGDAVEGPEADEPPTTDQFDDSGEDELDEEAALDDAEELD